MPPDLVTGFTIFALVAIAVMLFIGVQARIVTEQLKKRTAEMESAPTPCGKAKRRPE